MLHKACTKPKPKLLRFKKRNSAHSNQFCSQQNHAMQKAPQSAYLYTQ